MASKVEIEGDQERTNFVLQMGWVFWLATLFSFFPSFLLLVTLAHAMFKVFFFLNSSRTKYKNSTLEIYSYDLEKFKSEKY